MSTITLNPTIALPGVSISVMGTGFGWRWVQITDNGVLVNSFRASRKGTFSTTISTPATPGPHTIAATSSVGSASAVLTVTSSVPVPIPPPPSIYTLQEECDNLARWRTLDYIGSGQEAKFAASQVTAANSIFSIAAVRTPTGWLSGCITTDPVFRQLYGYFEASIKIPKGKGMWPAFWLLDKPWSQAGELDIMEILANPIGANGGNDAGYLISTVHYPYQSPYQSPYGKRSVDLSLGFHVYAMDWRKDHVAFLLDNVEFARFTNPALIPNFAMPVILNLAVGGGWASPSDSTTPNPSIMEIDWVRVRP